MSDTKWTPGPWDSDQGDAGVDHSHPYCSVFADGGGLIIAEVNDAFSTTIGRANAALIAAAPVTYRQLDETTDLLQRLLDDEQVDDCARGEIAVQIEYNRAALARARGEG